MEPWEALARAGSLAAVAVERDDLRLVWPPELFVAEARALIKLWPEREIIDDDIGRLLEEAFAEGRAARLAATLRNSNRCA
jgi:hypothetical protein